MRELKTRGREIVAAWDSYQMARDKAKEAAGLPELNRRWGDLNERRRRLWSRIAAMPARTVEGMHAKIAFASSLICSSERTLWKARWTTSSYRRLWITSTFAARRRAHPLRAASLMAAKLDCKRAPELRRALLKVAGAA